MPSLPAQETAASPAKTGPLDRLATHLQGDLAKVNEIILDRMQSDIPLIPQLAGHLIAAGGKRIRPLLTLASAELFGHKGGRQHKLAACVEFIHTASLLHDDVVDASNQRRGRASANALFGNEAAVLVGDFLFSRSFQLMVEDGSLDVLRILSNAAAVIAEGEVLQLSTANNLATTEEQYMTVIGSKTAELFAAACEVGAIVANRAPAECRTIREYGLCLGIAFQITDDVLDYVASEARLGKTVGDDFREGKITLPVIKALEHATPKEREFWHRCMTDLNQTDKDFREALRQFDKYYAIGRSLELAREFAKRGRQLLVDLPTHPLRNDLAELITFAVERDY
jgi:octaprenyl-diphosphate synthase